MLKKRPWFLIAVLVWVGLIRASDYMPLVPTAAIPPSAWAEAAIPTQRPVLPATTAEPTAVAALPPTFTASAPTRTALPPTVTPEPTDPMEEEAPEGRVLHAAQKMRNEPTEIVPTVAYDPVVLELLKSINAEREKVNAPPLELSPVLTKVAQEHSEEMAKHDFFSHNSLNGLSFVIRIRNAGYKFTNAAENLFAGNGPYNDATYVVNTWLRSPSHRQNMLNPIYTEAGIGYKFNESSTYGGYFTVDFGKP